MKSLESTETETDSCINNYFQDIDKKKTEEQKSLSISVSLISKENIDRCWLFFSDLVLCQSGNTNMVIDYKFDKGDNTYKVGNEFSCYWIGISKAHYKCLEVYNNYLSKKISWIISLDIGILVRKTYFIYPITSNNKALIKMKFGLLRPEKDESLNVEETKDYYYHLQNSIMHKISKIMEESKKFNFIQESFIAHTNRENCWKFMTDFNKLSKISSGEIGENFICRGNPEKSGTFWKCNLNDYHKIVYLRVKNISKSKKRNTWVYCLETIGSDLYILKQEIEISLTKINNNFCQISILIKFNEKFDRNIFNLKKKKLNDVMKKIKEFINENNKN